MSNEKNCAILTPRLSLIVFIADGGGIKNFQELYGGVVKSGEFDGNCSR